MAITAENYEKARAYATREGLSEPVRQKLLAELAAYESGFQDQIRKASPKDEPYTLATSGQMPTEQSLVSAVKNPLDPKLPLVPQALAVQPATTHPGGDAEAESEWLRKGSNADAEPVIVYDAPLRAVRKALLENPGLIPAIYDTSFVPHAQDIVNLNEKSPLYQAYQDYMWRQTAEEAAKAGRTAYRYSKAPWLQDGSLGGSLGRLKLKLGASTGPAVEGAIAFVMGLDKTVALGAGRAAGEAVDRAAHPQGQGPAPEGTAGGIASVEGASPTEVNDMINEEHPLANAAGQALGYVPGLITRGAAKAAGAVSTKAGEALARSPGWSASNALFETISNAASRGARKAVERGGAVGFGTKIAAGAAAGGVAAAAQQAGVEATSLAGRLAQGEPADLSEVSERVKDAGVSGAAWGGGGGALAATADTVGKWTRTGARYEKAPQQLERAGVEFKVGRGPVPPKSYRDAEREALERDTGVEDVIAERLEPVMSEGARAVHREAKQAVSAEKRAFYPTEEGRAELPVTTLVTKARDLLDKHHSGNGKPRPVGTPNAGDNVYDVLNANIEGISLEPVEGAVALSRTQAATYLSPERQKALLEMRAPQRPPPKAPFPPASDLPRPRAEELRGVNLEPGARPPPHLPVTTPGAGQWRDPRPLGEGRIAPHPQVDATSTLENHYRQRDLREAARAERPRPLRGERQPEPWVPGGQGTREGGTGALPPAKATPETGGPAPKLPDQARREVGQTPEPLGPQARAQSVKRAKDVERHLESQGVDTVYVVPRRYDAAHTDQAITNVGKRGQAVQDRPADRDMEELRDALYEDRKRRTMNGQPGAWSEMRQKQQERLARARDTRDRVVPRSTETGARLGAHTTLTGYAKRKAGELPTVRALREVAKKQGVSQELEQLRITEPLENIERRIGFGRSDNARMPGIPNPATPSISGRAFDAAHLRLAYPVLRRLEGPISPVGMGRTGRVATIPDRQAEDRREKSEKGARETYEARREAQVEAEKKKRAPKKRRPGRRRTRR